MRHTPALILSALLIAGCATSKPPPAAEPKAAPPPAAEPPPAHQNEAPAPKPAAKATLTMDLPGGWARIPPGMIGADDADGAFINPEKKGMILLAILPTEEDPKAGAEKMHKVLTDGGWKTTKIAVSEDGNLATFSCSKKDADGNNKGRIALRRVSGAGMSKTLMFMGRWPAANDATLSKDIDAIVASAAFK